jgi:hypothetical protein
MNVYLDSHSANYAVRIVHGNSSLELAGGE